MGHQPVDDELVGMVCKAGNMPATIDGPQLEAVSVACDRRLFAFELLVQIELLLGCGCLC